MFRAFAEQAVDLIFVTDLDGNLVYVNPTVERTLRLPEEHLVGGHMLDLVHPEDRDSVRQQMDWGRQRFRVCDRGGSWRWIDATIQRVRLDGTQRIVGVARPSWDTQVSASMRDSGSR